MCVFSGISKVRKSLRKDFCVAPGKVQTYDTIVGVIHTNSLHISKTNERPFPITQWAILLQWTTMYAKKLTFTSCLKQANQLPVVSFISRAVWTGSDWLRNWRRGWKAANEGNRWKGFWIQAMVWMMFRIWEELLNAIKAWLQAHDIFNRPRHSLLAYMPQILASCRRDGILHHTTSIPGTLLSEHMRIRHTNRYQFSIWIKTMAPSDGESASCLISLLLCLRSPGSGFSVINQIPQLCWIWIWTWVMFIRSSYFPDSQKKSMKALPAEKC